MNTPNETRVSISKLDAKKQIAYGVVYVPYVPDSQGDYMTPQEIERVAHNFLKKGAVDAIDTEHNLSRNGSTVVESFISREGDPDFPVAGSWVLGVHIPDKAHWEKAERGELGGFSMYGTGRRVQRIVEIEVPDDGVIIGKTEASSGNGAHEHEFLLEIGADGAFGGGQTDEVNGHSHLIKKGTVTEPGPDGHRHRFNFIEALAKGCSGLTDEQKKWKAIRENQRKKMHKGDFPGHPFRGNQYVDGEGGGASVSDGNPLGAGGGGGGVKWSYKDARGVERTGVVERTYDKGGGDVTYAFRNSEGGLDMVSGANLKAAKVLTNPFTGEKIEPKAPAPKPVELTRSGHRPLSTIAREIRRDWGGKVNYAAKPYLDAMASLYDIKENYGMDTAESVVAYFLSNARSWKGDKAKEVKAELKKIIGIRKEDMDEDDMPETDGEQGQALCDECRTPRGCKKAGRCLISYEDEDEDEDEDEVKKGDFPGHPFRGNQYTDGEGGGTTISNGGPEVGGGGGPLPARRGRKDYVNIEGRQRVMGDFQAGKAYVTQFSDGEQTFFLPQAKLKNGNWKGRKLNEGAGGRGRGKSVQDIFEPPNGRSILRWYELGEGEVPAHLR